MDASKEKEYSLKNAETDLSLIKDSLFREKKFLLKIFLILGVVTTTFTFTRQSVWEGNFQIVVANKEEDLLLESLGGANVSLGRSLGLLNNNRKKNLDTEIKILESPSVLLPVYEFVKNLKKNDGLDVSSWNYRKWLESHISVELAKNTSVLTVAYRDKDKKYIEPAIEMISSQYKNYSKQEKENDIDKSVEYINQQIQEYRLKSKDAFEKLNKFKIENELVEYTTSKGPSKNEIILKSELDSRRLKSILFEIEQQLLLLDKKDVFNEKSIYQAFNDEEIKRVFNPLFRKLNEFDLVFRDYYSKYKIKNEKIKTLEKRRELLIQAFREDIYQFLLARKELALSKIKASEKPTDVILKYKNLKSDSEIKAKLLLSMESQKQILLLSQAKNEDPWETISQPSLLDYPIAPRKKRYSLLGIFVSFIFASFAALYKEKRKNAIYDIVEIQEYLNLPIISKYNYKDLDSILKIIDVFISNNLNNKDDKLGVLILSNNIFDNFKNSLLNFKFFNKKEILLTEDFTDITKFDKSLIVIQRGINRSSIIELSELVNLQNIKPMGIIIIN